MAKPSFFTNANITGDELLDNGYLATGAIYGLHNDPVWRFFSNSKQLLLLEDLGHRNYRFICKVKHG